MESDFERTSKTEDDSAEEDVQFEPITEEELAEARHYSLLIQWSPEQDIFMVASPEIPQLKTHGDTQEEAVAQGAEAVAAWLWFLRSEGEPIPQPNYFY